MKGRPISPFLDMVTGEVAITRSGASIRARMWGYDSPRLLCARGDREPRDRNLEDPELTRMKARKSRAQRYRNRKQRKEETQRSALVLEICQAVGVGAPTAVARIERYGMRNRYALFLPKGQKV